MIFCSVGCRPGNGGEMNLAAGILLTQLALKHCQNKKQLQRIIHFAGRCVQIRFLVVFCSIISLS